RFRDSRHAIVTLPPGLRRRDSGRVSGQPAERTINHVHCAGPNRSADGFVGNPYGQVCIAVAVEIALRDAAAAAPHGTMLMDAIRVARWVWQFGTMIIAARIFLPALLRRSS